MKKFLAMKGEQEINKNCFQGNIPSIHPDILRSLLASNPICNQVYPILRSYPYIGNCFIPSTRDFFVRGNSNKISTGIAAELCNQFQKLNKPNSALILCNKVDASDIHKVIALLIYK